MSPAHAFGDFVLDTRRHSLRSGDREISIGERNFGVLRVLVENAGRVVGRQELMDKVWADVAVSDDSLARAISDVRSVLGDDPSNPRFIRTVHRQGYLFIAPVDAEEASEPEPSTGVLTARRVLWITLGFVVAGTLLVVVPIALQYFRVNLFGGGASPPPPDFVTWRLRALGPSKFISSAIKPAFAKSSTMLSVVAPDPVTGEHSIFLIRPDGGEPLQLTRGIEVRGTPPEFTADDTHILFTSFRSDPEQGLVPDVWRLPLPTGKPSVLIENASAASTSPDGRELVYAAVTRDRMAIRVRRPDGTELEVAERGFWPRWSPNGEWIAYTTSDPEGGRGTLHIVKPDGTRHRRLTTIRAQYYGLCWTPDSARVIFACDRDGPTALWSVDTSGNNLLPVTHGPGICSTPTLSADGKRLVFSFDSRRWFFHLADSVDEPARPVLDTPGVLSAALAPDGSRIALALGEEAQSPAVSIFEISTRERWTLSGMAALEVAWTPDGQGLVMAAPAPDGTATWIWQLEIDGGLPQPVMTGAADWRSPRPSPDGSRMAAVRGTPEGMELVVRDLDRGTDHLVAQKSVIEAPRWSSDGRFLAWSGRQRSEGTDNGGIWVCELNGGKPRRLTLDGAWPVWEPDGTHLLFGRFLHERGIWRVALSGGEPQMARTLEPEMADLYLERLETARDGRPILFLTAQFTGELYALEAPTDP